MAIAQFFLPSPLCSPVCDLALRRLRCDWESSIFSCDHDRKAEELDPYMTLSLMVGIICTIGCITIG